MQPWRSLRTLIMCMLILRPLGKMIPLSSSRKTRQFCVAQECGISGNNFKQVNRLNMPITIFERVILEKIASRKLLGRLETIKANNKANADKNKNKPEILVAEGIRFDMTIPVRVRVTRVIVNGQACLGRGR